MQYTLHPYHPLPVSQASKNFEAIPVIDVMVLSNLTMVGTQPPTTLSAVHIKGLSATAASFLVVATAYRFFSREFFAFGKDVRLVFGCGRRPR
jgi:hypothetical protein